MILKAIPVKCNVCSEYPARRGECRIKIFDLTRRSRRLFFDQHVASSKHQQALKYWQEKHGVAKDQLVNQSSTQAKSNKCYGL